ncbi:MAG: RdgB/HAM1 family non-canonical purine NTP pyrophosphatase [Ardenticatenales bacterium]|nr:RdgB/HAM1 family non-canonical purine NTP pyrophosphatase [Ardenticatenales bacterium]
MKQQLLVASHNQGKVAEFADMLGELDVAWLGLADVGVSFSVEESGTTLAENAILKAAAYARASGLLTLADDTGLFVDALDGEPGIYPARYGGPDLTPRQRYERLLRALADVPWEARTARFRCVIALARPTGVVGTVEGVCEGFIATTPAGTHGFGYDPVFYVSALGRTLAEMMPAQKHQISHRGKAIHALIPLLRGTLP